MTALHVACSEGHPKVVSVLLAANANIEALSKVRTREERCSQCLMSSMRSTPLHWASFRGHVEVVSLLLAAGAQIEARDSVSE
jgi:ankyrin repeat protein